MIAEDTLDDLAKKHKFSEERIKLLKGCLFEELFENAPSKLKVMLKTQYRMHSVIMEAINQFYDEHLVSGLVNPDLERRHHCQNPKIKESDHIMWIDTPLSEGDAERKQGTSFINVKEVDYAANILQILNEGFKQNRKDAAHKKEVGVITFYAAQERLMRQRLQGFDALDLRIGTVDRFQGMERPIILVSFVRNNKWGKIGFARERQRVNVALSRAQELLIIIGCGELFCYTVGDSSTIKIYRKVIQLANKHQGVRNVLEFCGS